MGHFVVVRDHGFYLIYSAKVMQWRTNEVVTCFNAISLYPIWNNCCYKQSNDVWERGTLSHLKKVWVWGWEGEYFIAEIMTCSVTSLSWEVDGFISLDESNRSIHSDQDLPDLSRAKCCTLYLHNHLPHLIVFRNRNLEYR